MTAKLEIYRPILGCPGSLEALDDYADRMIRAGRFFGDTQKPIWSKTPKARIFLATGELATELFDDDMDRLESAAEIEAGAEAIRPRLTVYSYDFPSRAPRGVSIPNLKLAQHPYDESGTINPELIRAIDEALQFARNGLTLGPDSHIRRGVIPPIPLLGFGSNPCVPSEELIKELRARPELSTPRLKLGPIKVEFTEEGRIEPRDYGLFELPNSIGVPS